MLYRLKNNDHSNLSAQAEVQQSGAARGIPPEVIKNRSLYGFDQPAHVRFGQMVGRYLSGDFGESFTAMLASRI